MYKIKKKYQGKKIVTTCPDYRTSGVFILNNCTQTDLQYLHDVVKHPAVYYEPADEE